MSRAFVRESDLEDVDQLPERTHSDNPNYITAKGLCGLEATLRELQTRLDGLESAGGMEAVALRSTLERDQRYVKERLRRAIVVETPGDVDKVRFGHRVKLRDDTGREYTFTLVGEDEVDVECGRISWASPLGRLLAGGVLGDEVQWPRGDSSLAVEIVDIVAGP